jgi:hypothetical protein
VRERFGGQIREGKLLLDEPARWRGAVARHTGKRVSISLERYRKGRSLKANAYLWGVVYRTIAEWCGHTDDELHEIFKSKFLPRRELLLPTGEEIPLSGTTAALDTDAFSEYVSKVKLWAAEQGVHVPDPDEVEVEL